MKAVTLAFALLSAPAFAAEAPFCLINNTGQATCHYNSLNACELAQRSIGGLCAANPKKGDAPTFLDISRAQQPTPDIAGSFQRGMREGQTRRMEREEHEARMAVLRAQADALKAQRPETNNGYWVMYQCPDETGAMAPSAEPRKGCVVDYVTAW